MMVMMVFTLVITRRVRFNIVKIFILIIITLVSSSIMMMTTIHDIIDKGFSVVILTIETQSWDVFLVVSQRWLIRIPLLFTVVAFIFLGCVNFTYGSSSFRETYLFDLILLSFNRHLEIPINWITVVIGGILTFDWSSTLDYSTRHHFNEHVFWVWVVRAWTETVIVKVNFFTIVINLLEGHVLVSKTLISVRRKVIISFHTVSHTAIAFFFVHFFFSTFIVFIATIVAALRNWICKAQMLMRLRARWLLNVLISVATLTLHIEIVVSVHITLVFFTATVRVVRFVIGWGRRGTVQT